MWKLDILISGFPGVSDRGFMGWSSVCLIGPEPKILFDTGSYGYRKILAQKLNERGYTFDDIDYLILSHSHYDHSINWRLFKKAEIIMHQKEYQYARECGDGYYLMDGDTLCDGLDKSGRLRLIKEKEVEVFPDILLLHTPGHTPGSISLLIKREEKTIALTSDAIKNFQEARDRKAALTLDPISSTLSITQLIERSNVLVPGHDNFIYITENKEVKRPHKAQVKFEFPEGLTLLSGNSFELEV